MNLTLNQIIDILRMFSDNHIQIKRFDNGELLSDIETMISDSNEFPVMWVQYVNTSYPTNTSGGFSQKLYSFNILLFDILKNDKTNETEIINDMAFIGEDLVKFLQNDSFDFEISGQPKIIPFTERFTDMVAGVNLQITIQVDFNGEDNCESGLIDFTFSYSPPGNEGPQGPIGPTGPAGGGAQNLAGVMLIGNTTSTDFILSDGNVFKTPMGLANLDLQDDLLNGNAYFLLSAGGINTGITSSVIYGDKNALTVGYADPSVNIISEIEFSEDILIRSSYGTWSWPNGDGTTGQSMKTDGNGDLYFGDSGASLTFKEIGYGDSSNTITSTASFRYVATTQTLQLIDGGSNIKIYDSGSPSYGVEFNRNGMFGLGGKLKVQGNIESGTNKNGQDLEIYAGQSTGIGQGGNIIVGVSSAGAGGTSLNPLLTKVKIAGNSGGTVTIGDVDDVNTGVKIIVDDIIIGGTRVISMKGLKTYVDNAAAVADGLTASNLYIATSGSEGWIGIVI